MLRFNIQHVGERGHGSDRPYKADVFDARFDAERFKAINAHFCPDANGSADLYANLAGLSVHLTAVRPKPAHISFGQRPILDAGRIINNDGERHGLIRHPTLAGEGKHLGRV